MTRSKCQQTSMLHAEFDPPLGSTAATNQWATAGALACVSRGHRREQAHQTAVCTRRSKHSNMCGHCNTAESSNTGLGK